MKRNINLQELSRDHHHGLLLGWKIRQGLKFMIKPGVIAEYVVYFTQEALVPHFKEEEENVLGYLTDNDPLKLRTLKDHQDIARLVDSLSSSRETTSTLLEVADLVDTHIRFEERELFPYLEKVLDDEVLEKIGVAIAQSHQPFVESYPFEFWKRPANSAG